VGYCARLKAIGVNIFRATKVKRSLDPLRNAPATGLSGVCSTISIVKELFLSPWRQLRNIFNPVAENTAYAFNSAA
jgi:hypothetical protein